MYTAPAYKAALSLNIVLDTVKVLEFFLNSAPVAEIAPPQRPELLTKLEPLTVALPIVVIAPTKLSPFL